ncbi:MAG: gliding motility-associated C-terminal domain-containing protein, partial [Bacteroidota bacterium]
GGTIVLNSVGGVANTLTCNANGGNGGNQIISVTNGNEAEGPGGGGGGGYIAVSSGTPTRNTNGGNNGVTNSGALSEFTPNGATRGCPGINNASITFFTISATNTTVCGSGSVTLTATLGGNPPAGTITWYNAAIGGTQLGTGSTFTTPVLSATTTYWVGICPGTYRAPVTVTVNALPTVNITTPTSVCVSATSFNLSATPAGGTWSGTGITSSSNGTFSPSTAGTGTFTITYSYTDANGCTNTDTDQQIVTANPSPASINTVSPLCANSSAVTLSSTPSGGVWSGTGITNTSTGNFSPATSGTGTFVVTYSVAGSCPTSATQTITVNAQPTVTVTSQTVCPGTSVTISASGATTYSWNTGATTSSITVTPTVTTNYTVTGTSNSCTASATATVTVNSVATVSVNAVSPLCANSNTLTLSATPAGGTWSGTGITNTSTGVFSPSVSGVGTFTITYNVTGACTGSDQEVISVNAVPNSSITPVSPVCSNANSFNLSAATTGGIWSGTGITNTSNGTFSPSSAGTGSVVVTYSISGTCPSSSTTTVTVNASPTVSVNSPTVCAGNSVTLNASGGTTYSWNTGANTPSITITPTVSTTYTVTGTIGSCTANAVSNVSVTPVTSVSITPVSTLCTNGGPIVLGANVAGGTWSGTGITNSTSGTFDPANSGAGTFTVTYVSSGTCPGTDQETITVNNPPNTSITPIPTVCSNDVPFSMNAATTGGVWTGNGIMSSVNGTFDPSIAGAGSVVVTYSVSGTCPSSSNYTVTINPAPSVSVTSQTICPGGTATLTASGATVYVWDSGSLNSSIAVSPTVTTNYTVAGTTNGCSDTAVAIVTVNPPQIININPVSALCENAATTSLNSNVSGGVWSGTGITDIVNGTFDPSVSGAGSFTITYNVSGACGGTDSETIIVNAAPVITAGSNSPVCVNLNLSLTSNTINGAVYSWSGPNGFISPLEDPTINNAQINASGSYTLSVSNNGCTSTTVVTATVNPIPTANAGNDAFVCQGSSVVLNGSGVGSYLWTPSLGLSSDTISGPAALPNVTTLYVLTVDAGGCTDSDSVLVTVSPTPVLNTTNDTTVCLGQCLNLNVTGADYYTWNSSPGLNNLSDSSHSVCPNVSSTYTVTGYITSTNSVYNGDFSLGNNGFYSSYTYSSNTQPEGTYYVSTNANFTHPGFTGLDHTTGTGNFLIVNGSGTPNSSVWCQTITVQPNTDYVFSCWVSALAIGSPAILQFNINGVQLGNTFQAPLNTGVWSQFFTTWNSGSNTTAVICIINQNTTLGGNDFGLDDIFFSSVCTSTKTISVTVNQPQDPTITQAGPFCSGDTAAQLTSASVGGVWSGTGVDTLGYFSPLQTGAGTFTVSYSYSGVCPAQDTMVISVIQSADASITQNNATFCVNGGITNVSSLQSGGVWSGTGIINAATGIFDPAIAGIGSHDIIYTLSGTCGDQDTAQFTVVNSFDATINQVQSLCSGDAAITLSAASPGGIWSGQGITNGGSGIFDPTVSGAGTFIVTYSISGVCGSTDTASIFVNPSADASILTNASTLCSNQNAITLTTAQGGGVWSGTGISSGGVFNPSTSGSGNFQLIYTINGPCGDADTTAITVNSAPNALPNASMISGCAPFCTTFNSGNGNSWLWNFTDGTTDNTQNPSHCFNIPGVYSVSVVVSNANCTDTGYVTITSNNVAVANFGTNPAGIISPGTSVSFTNNSTGTNNYIWNFGDPASNIDTSSFNSPNYVYVDTGTYCITMIAFGDGGCNDTAINCIMVIDEASIEIPNIFTPNGDGSNDFFFIKTVGVKDLTCIIYDRWGLKVAEFSGVNGKWDGTMNNGNIATNGTYFFIVDYETIQGKTGTAKGYVQLIGNN